MDIKISNNKKCPICGKPIEIEYTEEGNVENHYCSDKSCPWFSTPFNDYFDTI
jgi:hypothetical protein